MLLTNWLQSLTGFSSPLIRRQRRVLAARRRRAGSTPLPSVQRLEPRTLLAAPNPVDLGSLTGTDGFRLDGVAASHFSGYSVSNAGDVNGDGFEDLILGAWGTGFNGADSGSTYIVFGRSGGFTSALDLGALDGSTGFRLDGGAFLDRSGSSVSGTGDVNGDGFSDLIIGARGADSNGTDSGSSYVLFGNSSGFSSVIDLSSLDGTTGFRLDGVATDDLSGTSVSGAGDVNGDGFDDLIVGAKWADPNGSASGSSYVLFGRSSGFASVIDLSSLDGTTGFRLDGVGANDESGHSVSSAGDVNGDGFDDLIVGAFHAGPNGNTWAGSSYVMFGNSGAFASVLNLSALNGTTGFRLDGVAAFDRSGASVSSAGDVNGDGFDDLIVGAYRANPNGNSAAGSSYVLFGRPNGFGSAIDLSTLDGTSGFRLDGVVAGDGSGFSISGAGDVNGDGFDDLIVGAYLADPNGSSSGSSYVLFGKPNGFGSAIGLSTLDGTSGFRLDGVADDDRSGFSISGAGDVNGDGFDDLIVGAHTADPNGNTSAGSSYVVFGGNFTGGAETQVGGDGGDLLFATQGIAARDVLVGGRGGDHLFSDGGPDVLRGGEGIDTLIIPDVDFSGPRRIVGGTGTDTLRLDGPGLTLDLTQIPDNRITGIEGIRLSVFGETRLILNSRELLNLSDSLQHADRSGGERRFGFRSGNRMDPIGDRSDQRHQLRAMD